MEAVVYVSNSGFTAEYAKMIGKKTGLPVHSFKEACKKVKPGAEIIYLGWLMANVIKDYKKANEKFKICAVAGVGMGKTGSNVEEVRKTNLISKESNLFTLQGGFDINRLHGMYKLMMKMFTKAILKDLAQKQIKTADDEDTAYLLKNGGSRVSESNLNDILNWFESEKVRQSPNK